MKKSLIGIIASMTFLSVTAHADLKKGSQTMALFGGIGGSHSKYEFEPGEERSVSGGGGAFGGQYLYYITDLPAIALGVDLNRSFNGDGEEDDMITGFNTTARVESFVGMAIARLAFPRGKVRPYLFGGLGGHRSTQMLSAQPHSGNTWSGGGAESRVLVDERRTGVAVGYGIGLDVFPTETVFLGLELRGAWLGGLNTDETAATRAAGLQVEDDMGIKQGNIFLRVGFAF